MLPPAHRLRRSQEFRGAVRSGVRAGSRTVVVHVGAESPQSPGPELPQIGFIVSKSVGSAVTRNRVKRRLRHLSRQRLASMPAGAVVVRALPAAASASYAELGSDLDHGIRRVRLGAGRSVVAR